MAKFNIKEFAGNAIVPAVAINVAGVAEPYVDNFMNKNVKELSSNAAVNTNAKYAKYMKMGLYTLVGLGAQAVAQVVDGGKEVDFTGKTVGLFMYGLSGATAAEDPVMNIPGGYRTPGNTTNAPAARQVVTRTANFIS